MHLVDRTFKPSKSRIPLQKKINPNFHGYVCGRVMIGMETIDERKFTISEVTFMMQMAKYTYVDQNINEGILKQLEIRPVLDKFAK